MEALKEDFTLFFERVAAVISNFHVKDLLDILFVALLIYGLLRLIRETRGVQLLKGVFWLFLVWGAVQALQMTASIFIFRQGFDYLVVILAVLFQPEIRSMFERVGRSNVSNFRFFQHNQDEVERKAITIAIQRSCAVFEQFSKEHTGALVVFEHVTMLGEIIKTGTVLQAKVSRELLSNLFYNKAPLHDGAAVIRKGHIEAAGCILPLSQNQELETDLGMRHRAALGVSEVSDAMVAVVSEETGQISLAHKGQLQRDISMEELKQALLDGLLLKEAARPKHFRELFRKEHPKK